MCIRDRPCGQVFGFPRLCAMRSSISGLMACSSRHASSCTSSHAKPRISVSSLSERRCLLTTFLAILFPSSVRHTPFSVCFTRAFFASFFTISETDGGDSFRCSARRDVLTGCCSCCNLYIDSRYSSILGVSASIVDLPCFVIPVYERCDDYPVTKVCHDFSERGIPIVSDECF